MSSIKDNIKNNVWRLIQLVNNSDDKTLSILNDNLEKIVENNNYMDGTKSEIREILWQVIEHSGRLQDQKDLSNIFAQYIGERGIIYRVKKYYPIGGYITEADCSAYWIEDDIVEFTVSGWRYTIIGFKYCDGLYYKIYKYRGNVNGRWRAEPKHYNSSDGLTEQEVLDIISKIKD